MEPYPLSQSIALIVLCCISLMIRAMLSFLETSITALRIYKLKELSYTEKQYTPLLQTLEKSPQRVLITILVANSFIDVTSASLATFIVGNIFIALGFPSGFGFLCGITIATTSIIIFGEIIPKSLARARSEQMINSLLWLINIVYITLYPIVAILIKFSEYIMYKVGGKEALESSSQWISSEREIQFLINYIHEKGLLELEKREMLQNIFELTSTQVKKIMIPATNIISVEVNSSIDVLLDVFSQHPLTRFPVYENMHDNIVGMVHQRDVLLNAKKDIPLKEIVRPILFVPESMKINQLMRNFREKQIHMALAINEYGIITGLVTLEDVFEEIVGEISDEYDPTIEKIVAFTREETQGWLVNAHIDLEDLGEFLGIHYEAESASSLAGFLAEYLQHIPQKGEKLWYKGFMFEIEKATLRVVQVVYIYKPTE